MQGYLDADDGFNFSPLRVRALSILVTIILSGSLVFFSRFFRASTWMLWGMALLIIVTFTRELPLRRLLRPMAPYLSWLLLYLAWGVIITTRRDFHFITKTLVGTLLLAGVVAILTSTPRHLKIFATTVQFAAVVNILVLFLSSWSSQVDAIVTSVTMRSAAMDGSFNRYGGMWGNPNMGAYICLIVVIFSAFAVPWAGWLGRLCCLPIFYLSASRKGAILFILITLLYMALVKARDVKFWLGGIAVILTLVAAFSISGTLRQESRSAAQNAYLARMIDVRERYAAERGAATRMDLLNEWLEVAAREPWYGYGLNAMAGTQYDEDNPSQISQKGLVENGTHNTWLGVWIDVGPFGFFLFLLMMVYYAARALFAAGPPDVKWVLISLALVNISFLFVSHSQLTCFEGETIYALLFLLPSCPALLAQRGNPEFAA